MCYVFMQLLFTLELSIGHQRATEGDSTDVGAEVRHNLGEVGCGVSGEMGILDHVFSHTGKHGSQAHQAVEGSHQLGQVSNLDPLSDGQA